MRWVRVWSALTGTLPQEDRMITINGHTVHIGTWIKVRPITRYSDGRAVWRKVNGFIVGNPTIRFGGYKDFRVRLSEIEDVKAEG